MGRKTIEALARYFKVAPGCSWLATRWDVTSDETPHSDASHFSLTGTPILSADQGRAPAAGGASKVLGGSVPGWCKKPIPKRK